jgi:hypothetical protein
MLEEAEEKEEKEGGGDCDVFLTQSLRTIPCWLCETIYLIYSQLPFLSGGLFSIHNFRMHHATLTGTITYWETDANYMDIF